MSGGQVRAIAQAALVPSLAGGDAAVGWRAPLRNRPGVCGRGVDYSDSSSRLSVVIPISCMSGFVFW